MNITRGKITGTAKKVLLYGPEGIGKSTFASQFPDPLFIDTEGSTKELDIARFDAPSSWTMLTEQVRYVTAHPDVCRTLVIDTADWAERLCVEHICSENQIKSIESISYGKGYTYIKEEFGKLLNLLTDVIEKGINVVLTAHAWMRKFDQPDEMGSYDRWELKLSKQCAPLVKEWTDMILFANYKTIVVKNENKKNKAQGGRRVMYTSHHSCWDAKNRFGLPEEVPFEFGSIAHLFDSAPAAKAIAEEKKPEPEPAPEPAKEEPKPKENVKPEPEPEQETLPFGMPPEKPAETPPPEPEEKSTAETGKLGAAVVTDENLDKRIPKALRDLMLANSVCDWDIQMVVSARGYYPNDVNIWDYDPDFINGVLVAAWDQVHAMIKEMREKEVIPFG